MKSEQDEDEKIEREQEFRELLDRLTPFDLWQVLWYGRWKLAKYRLSLLPGKYARWMWRRDHE